MHKYIPSYIHTKTKTRTYTHTCIRIAGAFHEVPKDATAKEWVQFFEKYDQAIRDEGMDADERAKAMKLTNPKYIMRNWMMTVCVCVSMYLCICLCMSMYLC